MDKKEEIMNPTSRMLGAKICQIRIALGLNQTELAKRTGYTRVSITNIELGRYGNLTLEKVERFALAVTTTPKNLMKGIWF